MIRTTEEVQKLYAAAIRYDPDHVRAAYNAEEFDEWLERHDAETKVKAIEEINAIFESLDDNARSRNRSTWDAFGTYVYEVQVAAGTVTK